MCFAPQRNSPFNVRFGSKADMCSAQADVCFVPIADIAPKKRDRLAAVSPSKDALGSNGLFECLLCRLIGAIESTASFPQCSH